MASSARRWLVIGLNLVLTVAVTVFIVRRLGVDLGRLSALDLTRWRWRPLPILASVVLLGLGYLTSAALWGRMVREMGGPTLPVGRAVPLFMVANLGRYVPGKVVQIAGLTVLARREGVPAPVAAGAAALGQGIALLGATLVGLGAFFGPGIPVSIRRWGWIGLGALAVFLALGSVPSVAQRLERVWLRMARVAQSGAHDPARRGGFALRWVALYSGNWVVYAAAFWLLYVGLEGFVPFLQAAPAFAAAYVGGYLALFAPAGLGVREGLLAAFLAPVLAPEPALAVALAARVWTTLVEVIPAAAMAPGILAASPPVDTPGHPEPPPQEPPS